MPGVRLSAGRSHFSSRTIADSVNNFPHSPQLQTLCEISNNLADACGFYG
jgi:hypothetical protein